MKPETNLPPGCSICRGASHISDERGARRCTCPRGIALAQMEHERRHPARKPAAKKSAHDGRAAAAGEQ